MQTAYQFTNANGVFQAVFTIGRPTKHHLTNEIQYACKLEIWQQPVGFGKPLLQYTTYALWSADGSHVAELREDAARYGWKFDLTSHFDVPVNANTVEEKQGKAMRWRDLAIFEHVNNQKEAAFYTDASCGMAWFALATNAAWDNLFVAHELFNKYNSHAI